MNLYDFIKKFNEEFNYVTNQWYSVDLKKLDKQEKTKLWNLFKQSYEYMKEDMIKGMSFKKFYSEYNHAFIIDSDGNKKMDAFIIYKEVNNYKKISLLGAVPTQKKYLIEKLIKILKEPGFFCEASLKIESILSKKANGEIKQIKDENKIKNILSYFSNKEIIYVKDGIYKRKVSLSGKTIEKKMYGNV